MFAKSKTFVAKYSWNIPSCRIAPAPRATFGGPRATLARSLQASSVILIWCFALACTIYATRGSTATAQVSTASVYGFVTDTSKAAIPGVTVTIAETQTGYSRTGLTNGAGEYEILAIPAGTYSFKVYKAGFATVTQTKEAITQQIQARVDFTLSVGAITETVSVQGGTPLLETKTPENSVTLSSSQISELPTLGHDYLQTAILSPGVAPVSPSSMQTATVDNSVSGGQNYKTVGISVTGGRPEFTAYNFNGVDVTDPGYGGNLFQPPPEAISSYRIVRGFGSAQFGGQPTVIYVNTKSGTNDYHGAIWEFNQNAALQARAYNAPSAPALVYNQPGGVFGGPLLPGLKNKTFIFGEFQATRMISSSPQFFIVPTEAEWNGDLSAAPEQLYNPFSINQATGLRNPFPNNQIPANLISPIAAKYKTFTPLPNIPNAPFGQINYRENIANINNDTQFMIRLDQNLPHSGLLFVDYFADDVYAVANGMIPSASSGSPLTGKEAEVQWDQPFGPNTLNTVRVGFYRSWVAFGAVKASRDFTGALGFRNYASDPTHWGFPATTITGGVSVPTSLGYDFNWWTSRIGFYDNLALVRGHHTINIGGIYQPTRYTLKDASNPRGALSYAGNFTQESPTSAGTPVGLADFLLGAFSSVTSDPTGMSPWLTSPYYALYAEDSIQVTNNLNISLGLRWDWWAPPVEKFNRWVTWDPRTGKLAFVLADPEHWQTDQTRNPAYPRGMFTNWKKRNFSPRVGISFLLTPRTTIRAGAGIYYAQGMQNFQDFSVFSGSGAPPFDNSVTVNNDPSLLAPARLDSSLFDVPAVGIPLGEAIVTPNIHDPQPYVEQATFSIERQLGNSLLLSIGYNGTLGRHLPDGGVDANQGSLFNPSNPLTLAQRRPFPDFDFIYLQSNNTNSSYNGLFLSFEKRYSNGLQLIASYTWSKSLDAYSGSGSGGDNQNALCIECDYGLSDNNLTSHFTVGYLWNLPFGPGRRFATHGVASAIGQGWRFGGITQIMSGTPFTATTSAAYINASDFTLGPRSDRVCNGNLGHRTLQKFFDTACFPAQARNTFGDEGRNVIIGPGAQLWDVSLARTFPVWERLNLELRADAFSIFNHQNWGTPDGGVFDPTFGQIQSKSNPRTIQFGGKLSF